jgi:hypothetical protein
MFIGQNACEIISIQMPNDSLGTGGAKKGICRKQLICVSKRARPIKKNETK